MRKRIISYGLIFVILIAGAFFVFNKKKVKPVVVKTEVAQQGDIKAYLSTTGTIKSKNSKEYYGIQARVTDVKVSVGDRVNRGDTLIVYDVSDLVNAVKQAEIQYSNAVLQRDDLINQNNNIKSKIEDLDNQIDNLEQSTNMNDKAQAESLKQQRSSLVLASDDKLKLADNSVSLAKLTLGSAKQRLSQNKGSITAEAGGVVTSINVTEGTIGNSMQPAVVVQDVDNLSAAVSLGKYDANKVRVGQEVIIRSGEKEYRGKVAEMAPVATNPLPQAGGDASLAVKIDILDSNPQLKIDFDVDVDILTGQVRNVIKIPAECLRTEKGDVNLAYVLEGNIIHERSVKVGLRSDTDVEVQEGIKAGEAVVLNPSLSVAEGVRAKEDANAGGK